MMQLVKKKRLNEIKPVAFRQLGYVEEKSKPEKKLTSDPLASKNNEASLKIDSRILEEKKAALSPAGIQIEKPREAGALKKIREQILTRKQEPQTVRILSDDDLTQAWNSYLLKLQENNQVTSHHNLKTASISITNELQFNVFVTTKIQQQFIESERTNLLIHMQDFFNNPRLQFKISLDPEAEKEPVSTEQTLSQRDQYLKMISIYPLVKEMRDQLNLDLDY